MDYDKLIENAEVCCGDIDVEDCTGRCINPHDKRGEEVRFCRQWLIRDLYTAIETLRAENKRLKSLLGETGQELWSAENQRADRLQTERDTLLAANQHLLAEREQLTAERDAAQALLAERSGVTGSAPITTAFGVPLDRLRELVEADREGRCVVQKTDRKKLESAFNIVVKYGFCGDCKWIFKDKHCLECDCYQNGVRIISNALFGPEAALKAREQDG